VIAKLINVEFDYIDFLFVNLTLLPDCQSIITSENN